MDVYKIDYELPDIDCTIYVLSMEDEVREYISSIKRFGGRVVEISLYK